MNLTPGLLREIHFIRKGHSNIVIAISPKKQLFTDNIRESFDVRGNINVTAIAEMRALLTANSINNF